MINQMNDNSYILGSEKRGAQGRSKVAQIFHSANLHRRVSAVLQCTQGAVGLLGATINHPFAASYSYLSYSSPPAYVTFQS